MAQSESTIHQSEAAQRTHTACSSRFMCGHVKQKRTSIPGPMPVFDQKTKTQESSARRPKHSPTPSNFLLSSGLREKMLYQLFYLNKVSTYKSARVNGGKKKCLHLNRYLLLKNFMSHGVLIM